MTKGPPVLSQVAERMLPACFMLLEAAVETLASDAERQASSSVDDPMPRLTPECATHTAALPRNDIKREFC